MEKYFKLGLILGRFQSFHKGHEYLVDTAVKLCDRVCVLVGSAQESGTFYNPYTYEYREEILHKIYGDSISVFPIKDMGFGNNSRWGEYVLETVYKDMKEYPDLLISANEQRRIDWFDGITGVNIAELTLPKQFEISGTKLREFLLNNDIESWKNYTDEKIWDEFDKMREILENSKENKATDSI